MKKLRIILSLLILVVFFKANSQDRVRDEIRIPEIDGFITLKCDLHTHTVFSDGQVWPDFRVGEAWKDGLDVIAITDHVEYLPHQTDMNIDRNRSYDIAAAVAHDYNLIVIKGAEITREYPYGHFNCLFINDAEKLNLEDPFKALEAAKKQGAFIQWNHPGWRQKNIIPIWYDFQEKLYKEKMIHAIEIANSDEYYPLAFEWAKERGFTITGNSDIHGITSNDFEHHRPITLVFAKERSVEGVREALENKRTAVYVEDTIIGAEDFIKPIAEKSIKILNSNVKMKKGQLWQPLMISNNSTLPLCLEQLSVTDPNIELPRYITVPPMKTTLIIVKGQEGLTKGTKNVMAHYMLKNFQTAPAKGIPVEIKFSVEYTE